MIVIMDIRKLDWKPQHYTDIPPAGGVVVSVERQPAAATFCEFFNREALRRGAKYWAVCRKHIRRAAA